MKHISRINTPALCSTRVRSVCIFPLQIVQTHLWLVGVNCRQINWMSKCTKLQMTALGDVWKQFVKSPLRAAVCPSYRPLLHRQSGKVGQMLRVREAPVGYWEWWFWHRVRRSKGKRWRGSGSSFTWSDPALELVQPREKWEKGVSRQTLIYIYTWNTNSQCSLPEWRETRPADAHWNHEFRTVKSKLSGKKKKKSPRWNGWEGELQREET